MTEQDAYPLCWPAGWARTAAGAREPGQFDGTLDRIRRELLREIDRLVLGKRAANHTLWRHSVIISTNVPLRADGEMRADRQNVADPGVAVYFEYKKRPVCFACDRYDAIWKNLRAIQRTVEAMRGIERWGSSQLLDRAFTGFAALQHRTAPSCWEVLGVDPDVTEEMVLRAWREKAQSAHPDKGGSNEKMASLNEAKDIALASIRSRKGASV